MAQVIQGAFPQSIKTDSESKKDDKQVPSYILHISITFSDPLIWRRVQVPGIFTLAQLHDIIQLSMGWSDTHVHQFLVGKISYEPTMKTKVPREAKRFDEYKYKLHTLEEGMRFMFSYIYGAGEGWEHEIHMEEIIPPTRQLKHPILLAGEMACPPETVGDIHQYQQLITDLESPDNRKLDNLYDLTGRADFDPSYFDLEAAKKRVSMGR
jgi:hypothetical protein